MASRRAPRAPSRHVVLRRGERVLGFQGSECGRAGCCEPDQTADHEDQTGDVQVRVVTRRHGEGPGDIGVVCTGGMNEGPARADALAGPLVVSQQGQTLFGGESDIVLYLHTSQQMLEPVPRPTPLTSAVVVVDSQTVAL